MKTIILAVLLTFNFAIASDTSSLQTLILNLQNKIHDNGRDFTSSQVNEISSHLNKAIQAASGNSTDTYVRCRQAGYSDESCRGQGPGYLDCRKAGYSHESCNGQSEGYLACRKAGYSHETCSRN